MSLNINWQRFKPFIHESAYTAPTAVLIGRVEIMEQASIWFGSVLRGDVNNITIGARTNIQDGAVIHVSSKGLNTIVGCDVTVGHMALLHACHIENECLVGMRACVMDGARMEYQSMLAAGALLTPGKVIKSGELWAGVPAKFIRKLDNQEIKSIKESAMNYVDLAKGYKSNLI